MNYHEAAFADNKDLSHFELKIEGERPFIEYSKEGNLVYLNHTEVPEALEGKGIAGALVEKTFKYLEENNLQVVPLCSYIRVFLKRHPEWERLVTAR
ncbi:MAG: GNAT family N-acetyltransferase [Arcticibacter sp.]